VVTRGDIYAVRPARAAGHEQQGRRYAVVVQSDDLAKLSTVLVAPTSTQARPASFRPEIEIKRQATRVLVEQTAAIDIARLGPRAGRVTTEQQWAIDDAMRLVLGLWN